MGLILVLLLVPGELLLQNAEQLIVVGGHHVIAVLQQDQTFLRLLLQVEGHVEVYPALGH